MGVDNVFVCANCDTNQGDIDNFVSLKLLPCLHMVCKTCICDKKWISGDIVSCPKCDTKHQVPQDANKGLKTLKIPTKGNGKVTIEHSPSGEHTPLLVAPVLTCACDTGDVDGQRMEREVNGHNGAGHCGTGHPKTGENGIQTNVTTFCHECDCAVCVQCASLHENHDIMDIDAMLKSKKDYIKQLLKGVKSRMTDNKTKDEQLDILAAELKETKGVLETQISKRAEHLCFQIKQRKEFLLKEISTLCEYQLMEYSVKQNNIRANQDFLDDAAKFTEKLINANDSYNLVNLQNEISSRLLDLVHGTQELVEAFNISLDIPDSKGKEEALTEKYFGTLKQGVVRCGKAELVTSFNTDLVWPARVSATKSNLFVILGKTGAFEDAHGKLMIYDRHGKLLFHKDFDNSFIPQDVIYTQSGLLAISSNMGKIRIMSTSGRVIEEWDEVFKGFGHLAVTSADDILVTSPDENCIHRYNIKGKKCATIRHDETFAPHCLAVNSADDIVVCDYLRNAVFVFHQDGTLKETYESALNKNTHLKSPSALCCDPFSNMLIADFTGDRVQLVSPTGQFLGLLLTQEHGVSCPNAICLDQEGHLYVALYGGEIKVYRYLSLAKTV